MNNEWTFLPMRPSNSLLGDVPALRERLQEDSYLYFEQVLPVDKILALRRRMLEVLESHGWALGGPQLMAAETAAKVSDEGQDDFARVYDDLQRLEPLHTLAHDDDLLGIMRQVVGPTAFSHPLKVARVAFPENYEVSTPPHQDYPNNQGTTGLTAAWIPVGDCPRDLGALAIMRGSHRFGLRELDLHPGPGNRQAVLPEVMREALRWVTTDFAAGDVLLFPSLTVHASLHNASEFNLRLSVDFRYQQEGEALTDLVLHPHFQRLTWDDVYADWSSDAHQYYWKDLDYEVVPFVQLTDEAWESTGEVGLKASIAERLGDGSLLLDPEDWATILRQERRRQARHERRLARLGARSGTAAPEAAPGG
jgi:ectoine hydroxylase-related dioxygenase (phytanoyl-CoA dioxygenase family)